MRFLSASLPQLSKQIVLVQAPFKGMGKETTLLYVKMVRDLILKVKGLKKYQFLSNQSASSIYKISLETVYSYCYFTV